MRLPSHTLHLLLVEIVVNAPVADEIVAVTVSVHGVRQR